MLSHPCTHRRTRNPSACRSRKLRLAPLDWKLFSRHWYAWYMQGIWTCPPFGAPCLLTRRNGWGWTAGGSQLAPQQTLFCLPPYLITMLKQTTWWFCFLPPYPFSFFGTLSLVVFQLVLGVVAKKIDLSVCMYGKTKLAKESYNLPWSKVSQPIFMIDFMILLWWSCISSHFLLSIILTRILFLGAVFEMYLSFLWTSMESLLHS